MAWCSLWGWLGECGAKGAVCLLSPCTWPQHPSRLALVDLDSPRLSHVLCALLWTLPPPSPSLFFLLLLLSRLLQPFLQHHYRAIKQVGFVRAHGFFPFLYLKEDFTYSKFQRLLSPSFQCKKPPPKKHSWKPMQVTQMVRGVQKRAKRYQTAFDVVSKAISGVLKQGPNLHIPGAPSLTIGDPPTTSPAHWRCSRSTHLLLAAEMCSAKPKINPSLPGGHSHRKVFLPL